MAVAYDMTDISSSGGGPSVEMEAQESILSGVPSQTSSSSVSEHDRELRYFPIAISSKLLFFFGCAMYLWLAIDNLQWSHDARRIPDSVLEADDDTTWREYRSSQSGQSDERTQQQQQQQSLLVIEESNNSDSSSGYFRPSTAGDNTDNEDEITWSQFRPNGENRARHLRVSLPQSVVVTKRQSLRHRLEEEESFGFYTPWDELPFSTKIAAATLGYDADTWSTGGPVFTDTIRFEDLTPEQQEAAINLGYDQYLWDVLRGFTEPISDNTRANNADPTKQDWGSYFWSELPEEIRTAAEKLGYDEQSWNNGERTSVDDLFWDELTPEQQEAATALGFTQETWDAYAGETTTSTTASPATAQNSPSSSPVTDETSNTNNTPNTGATNSPNTNPTLDATPSPAPVPSNTNWRSVQWIDLPQDIRGGAIALGYTEALWNSGAPIATDKYFWDELSSAQQEAIMAIFGYDEVSWNAANNKWLIIAWNDLPSEIRSQASVLGYNQQLWDDRANLDTKSYSWDELSGQQQQAAFVVFGLTEESWSGASFGNKSQDIKNNGGGRGGGSGGADDDYVFSVQKEDNQNVWISKYQIVYFVASMCFVAVGILDIVRERRAFHVFMVLAGTFGVLAAMWVETRLSYTNIFHCFSVNFLVLQSISIFFYRKHLRALLPEAFKNALWLADVSFTLGALMKAILSFLYFSDDSREDLGVARAEAFAALLFLFSATIYVVTTPVAFLKNTRQKPYL